MRVEVLIPQHIRNGGVMLRGLFEAARRSGHKCVCSQHYQGESDVLILYGVGDHRQADARCRQMAKGGRVILWDASYFSRGKSLGWFRCSIDHPHPQRLLDSTAPDPCRWAVHGISLRNDYDPAGPIVMAGLGRKAQPTDPTWESRTLERLRMQYPGRRIIYRPKPKHPVRRLDVEIDAETSIDRLLMGSSLVVARHSNVAVDAVIAGIPIQVEDGAAQWLEAKDYSPRARLDFLRRLSWWQWQVDEAEQAWGFLESRVCPNIAVKEK